MRGRGGPGPARGEPSFLAEADPEAAWRGFLDACLGTVERAVRKVAADDDEARTVVADALGRIHADWPALLERWEATRVPGGSFRPWLAVVARNHAIDVLRSLHGRPTPPRAVQRLSPLAQRLYRLLYRERRTLHEAWEVLGGEAGVEGGFAALAAEARALDDALPAGARIAAAAPRRPERAVGTAGAGDPDDAGRAPPEPAARDAPEPAELLARRDAAAALGEVLAALPREDRLLLRAYYLEGATAREVARLLDRTPRQVYDRAAAVLSRLRTELSGRGLDPDDLPSPMDLDWTRALAPDEPARERGEPR